MSDSFPCPEPGCTGTLTRKSSKYGQFFGCTMWQATKCPGALGCHPDGRPLGTPADQRTRKKRVEAHHLFDILWKGKRRTKGSDGVRAIPGRGPRMSRGEAYAWLAKRFDRVVHMGESTYEQCEEIIVAVLEAFPDLEVYHGRSEGPRTPPDR